VRRLLPVRLRQLDRQDPLPATAPAGDALANWQDHNEKVEIGLLEGAAVVKPGRSALDQKIGDYFASCMDTATIEKKGSAPFKGELDRIRAMRDEPDVGEIARLHHMGVGALFLFGATPDAKDSNAPSPRSARAASRCRPGVLPEDRRQVRRDPAAL